MTSTPIHDKRQATNQLTDLLKSLKRRHRESQDALEALAEDIEDQAINSALDNLTGLMEDYRDTSELIEKSLQRLNQGSN